MGYLPPGSELHAQQHQQPPQAPRYAPNATLYITNLNQKIKEPELRKSLMAIFEQFGQILQIVAMQSLKRRGQAFVIFAETDSATRALDAMQDFPFYDKPMRLNYAKTVSDVIAKKQGTFVPRVKAPKGPKVLRRARPVPGKMEEDEDVAPRKGKRAKHAAQAAAAAALAETPVAAVAAAPAPVQYVEELPNQILFLTRLPEETTELMLSMLFNQFQGYREVRLVPGRHDIAFVEYESEYAAAIARQTLQNFKITPSHALQISFAKK